MEHIAESELIINSRGGIYHLDVRPEELSDTVILVGDPDRVAKVSRHFDSIEFHCRHREFITHTGYIGKKRFSVLSTGIGPDNIDIAINELDALVNIDFNTRTTRPKLRSLNLIRFGTSGALQADIPVDSLVASTHGLGLDNLLNYYEYSPKPGDLELARDFAEQVGLDPQITIPYVFPAGESLLEKFGKEFQKGITVTCPGFYGPQGRILRLGIRNKALIDKLTQFRHGSHRITNFEMETSAIYGLGSLLGHQCLSVNAIVANRVLKAFSKDGQAAVEKLIIKALEVLSAS